MRTSAVLILAVGLVLAACVDGGEPSTNGTLVVSTSTGGGDPDQDGYWLTVDGADSLPLAPTGTEELGLPSGRHSLRLHGVAQQCSVAQGPSREVTVADTEVVPVEFVIVCTTATGVIGVVVEASGPHAAGLFTVRIDGAAHHYVAPGTPTYVDGVSGGDHVVSLHGPDHCSIEAASQRVTISTGELIRDTVEVRFPVICAEGPFGAVRITAPTTGTGPSSTPYTVRYEHFGAWDYGGEVSYLGDLGPNDTLVAELPVSNDWTGGDPYWYRFYLEAVPSTCRVGDPHPYPLPGFTIAYGDTLEVEFAVACSP